jgi:acyl-coenzyme A synthetase/AMP-(fatty) acid ligase
MPVPDGNGQKGRSLQSLRRVAAATSNVKEETVSRFRKLSHTIWYCQSHVVWVPKYRFRVLHGGHPLPGIEVKIFDDKGHELPTGEVGELVTRCPLMIRGYCKDPK